MRTPFFGGFEVSGSTNVSDNQLINLYPKVVDGKSGKEVGVFDGTPGLDLLTTCGMGPVRGLQVMNGVLYAISRNKVYSVNTAFTATPLGTIGTSTGPVSMIANNAGQLAFFDGSSGYLISGGALTGLSLPFFYPGIASYQDGFGLVTQIGTNQIWQSNLRDLSKWDALNFSSADGSASDCVAIAQVHREQWVMKPDVTEVWVDAGNPGFAFQRLDGVFIEVGCGAPYSIALVGESLAWLTSNQEGQGQVVIADSYRPRRISTHSIERQIQSYPTIADAIGFSYQQSGHLFYVLTFPAGNATWVYDVTESALAGVPMWHKRAALSMGVFNRHWSNCYSFFAGKHVVGDYLTGNLYAFNQATKTDNGTQRKWLRSWRALEKPSEDPITFRSLRIDMQTGIGIPDGANPECTLRWTDDGGHNWSNEKYAAVGPTGATAQRVKFNRLGSTRRNSGLDRIFELSSSDAFGVALIGAELEA